MKVVTYIHKGKVKTISIDDLRKLKVELSNAWERTCENCGKCCFDKSLIRGVLVINYDKPCPHLKFTGRRSSCDVYDDRFAKATCFTVPEAIQQRCLPACCPYTKSAVGYKAPIDNGGWYKRIRDRMITAFLEKDEGMTTVAGTPAGGQATTGLPAIPPYKATGNPTREDLAKPSEWRRRRQALLDRKRQHRLVSAGKIGTSDPRQKTAYNIKPSGHALGG